MKRISVFLALGICATLLTGCYQKELSKDGLTFSYQIWVPMLVILGGLALIPAGIFMFTRGHRTRGIILAIAGPLFAVAIAPGMFMDRVIVNDESLYSRHGFWWSPIVHQVRYDELSQVNVAFEEHNGRGGKTYSYFFDCALKSGKTERIPLGDVMREALPDIAAQFNKHGVEVIIPPNLPD